MADLLTYRRGELLPPHFYFQAEAAMRIIFEESEGEELSPQPDPQRMYLLIAEGIKLIAHTGIICTMIEHQGATYKCYGLSGVFTFPAYRKKGYGRQLIEAANKLIREDASADIALLWTANHNVSFYAQHGWEPMPNMQTFVGDPAQPTLYNDENRLMLFLSEKGKQGRDTFERGQVYVGAESW
ncbi:MAG: GNAT family N-acetyltransferase [Chloroflexota bacterium]